MNEPIFSMLTGKQACSSGADCNYCETVWYAPPAYEDWGVRTVSGAANIIYSSTDPNDPLNGSHDPNGIYYPWFYDSGNMWYMKGHTSGTTSGDFPAGGLAFAITPNFFAGGWTRDITVFCSPYDLYNQRMWSGGDGAFSPCYSSVSYSGHTASTGVSVNGGGETITLTPTSITDPTVTISYPTINNSANKIACSAANNGLFQPIGWYGYYSFCSTYEFVPPETTCDSSGYYYPGGNYNMTPNYYQSSNGVCCNQICYTPYIDSSGCANYSCPQ